MTIDNVKNNLIKYTHKVFIEEEYGFVIDKKRDISAMVDFDTTPKSLRAYQNDEIPKQINKSWECCDLNIALNRIFNPIVPNEQDNRAFKVPQTILEKIWLQCKNKEEIDLFVKDVVGKYRYFFELQKLDELSNNDYKNFLITSYFHKDQKSHNATDNTLTLLIHFVKSGHLTLSIENLELMCKNEKRNLNELGNQALLKDFIENYMPDQIDNFKNYWKKIDISLVVDQDFLIEQPCYSIGFNKIQLYALAPTENTDFFQRRLQNLCTFLNKTATKKLIPLERIVFDGEQEAQTHYRFIIFSPNKPTLKFKQFLQDLVVYNIEFNKVPDMDDLRKVINYMLLQEKAQIGAESKVERKRKI